MKVVAFNGSPEKNGNTFQAISTVAQILAQHGIETEIIQLGGNRVSGCINCGYCAKNKNAKCGIDDDIINTCIEKMIAADGIIIGSPVYFGNVTTEVKALIDRAGRVTRGNGYLLKRKVGVPIVAARRAGTNFTYAAINFLFGISQMITPHSSYWNMTLSAAPGDYQADEEGQGTFKTLGENMAWLLEKTATE